MKPLNKIVAYYRLSQPKHGKSKLQTIRDSYGLEAQRRAVARFADQHNAPIIAEFSEIMSGRADTSEREELAKAIAMARLHDATLVVSKQDRLARSVHIISGLLEAGISFLSADAPHQTKRQILERAIFDEEEHDRIADRIRCGMEIAKERGVLFGSARPGHWAGREHRRGFRQATVASAKARRKYCMKVYRIVYDIICGLRAEGMSLQAVATELNNLGHVTTTGKPFSAMAVHRVVKLFRNKLPRRSGETESNSIRCPKAATPIAGHKQDAAFGQQLVCGAWLDERSDSQQWAICFATVSIPTL